MKILYHHRTRGRDVEGIHIREIIFALKRQGHQVYLASPPGVDPLNGVSSAPQNNKSLWNWISRYFPQIGFELLEICYNLVGYIKLLRMVNKYRVDAIYERYAFFTWVGTVIAKKRGIPVILEVNEVSGLERVRGQILVGLAKSVEKKIFKNASAIIVVSQFLKRHIKEMGIDADKIYVIPNAVNLDNFSPDTTRDELPSRLGITNKIVIGFVGILLPWNNLEFLLDVFKEISEEIHNVHLLLVGDGKVKGKLEAMVQDNGLNRKVTFTGKVSHLDVPKFIAIMDICVIPESNHYRSPVKLFEYLAMGKPVVAPRLEAIESVITDNDNGVLFELRNKNSLKNALTSLIKDSKKRMEIGDRARKTILEGYTWDENAKKIIEIYRSLTNGKRF